MKFILKLIFGFSGILLTYIIFLTIIAKLSGANLVSSKFIPLLSLIFFISMFLIFFENFLDKILDKIADKKE